MSENSQEKSSDLFYKYLNLKIAAEEALQELERVNKIIVLNDKIIANLKNVLV